MIKLPSYLRKLFGTHGELPPNKANMPIFITGCMRSGTTLLVDKLTTHPQLIKIGDELNHVWTKIGGAEMVDECKHKSASEANPYYTYQMCHYFFSFIEESKKVKRHLMRANLYFKTKRGRVIYDWKNIIPVNKSTHLMNKIAYLNASFPSSKVIIIVRDIYAHCSSMKMHFLSQYEKNGIIHYSPKHELDCWNSKRPDQINSFSEETTSYPPEFRLIPEMWFKLNLQALNEANRIGKDCIIVSYEDLIERQGDTLLKVFDSLALDTKYKNREKKIAGSILTHKNTTTQGNPLKKWQKYLSEQEIKIIGDVIAERNNEFNLIKELLIKLKV